MNFPDFLERQSSLITMESISKCNIKKYKSATLNPLVCMYVCMYLCISTEGSARPAVVPSTYF